MGESAAIFTDINKKMKSTISKPGKWNLLSQPNKYVFLYFFLLTFLNYVFYNHSLHAQINVHRYIHSHISLQTYLHTCRHFTYIHTAIKSTRCHLNFCPYQPKKIPWDQHTDDILYRVTFSGAFSRATRYLNWKAQLLTLFTHVSDSFGDFRLLSCLQTRVHFYDLVLETMVAGLENKWQHNRVDNKQCNHWKERRFLYSLTRLL